MPPLACTCSTSPRGVRSECGPGPSSVHAPASARLPGFWAEGSPCLAMLERRARRGHPALGTAALLAGGSIPGNASVGGGGPPVAFEPFFPVAFEPFSPVALEPFSPAALEPFSPVAFEPLEERFAGTSGTRQM
eukprot:CAMPEP_0180371724 /NCGR_PEP_ID=MMETSP0989-20121125/20019_1 /TAXON_ID=697907 /ORGANISM="non described non described, Strain CCMP2293" /LENGTH=133 /DNA_ID=CAMNT_0022367861 /DNA_START=122 /DNA_END=523 /DNA_ORIENTATION=-